MPDGSLAHQGVRGLAIAEMDVAGIPRLVLVSGGADGVLRRWDVSDHPPKEGVEAAPPIQLRGPYGGGKRPCIRALDVDRDTAACKILVGTDGCDVFEVTEGSNG